MQNIVAEALRNRAGEGDKAGNRFRYISAGEMTKATLINIGVRDIVQDMHNSRQRYNFMSSRKLRACVNLMQMGTV